MSGFRADDYSEVTLKFNDLAVQYGYDDDLEETYLRIDQGEARVAVRGMDSILALRDVLSVLIGDEEGSA